MIILNLEIGKTIENNPEYEITDFCLLLDLCFDISDYFTLTIHRFEAVSLDSGKVMTNDILDEKSNSFFQEMQPYFLKKIKAFDWGIFGVMNPPSDVYIFKCEKQAKSVIQEYFDDIYLRVTAELLNFPDKTCGMLQDLCFFKRNDMILATVSHEYMCSAYPPNEEIKNRFLEICEWNVYERNINVSKYPVEDILFGADYNTQPLYLFLQSMRTQGLYSIREKSLERLYYYVKGYCGREVNTADRRMNNMLMLIDDFFYDFVCSYYDVKEEIPDGVYRRRHWSEIIIEKSVSQEEAFDKFYELLDDFLDKNWMEFKKKYSILLN